MIDYESIIDISSILGLSISAIYTILSLCYFTYRYAKGDDWPRVDELDVFSKKDILSLLNPCYFKHPATIFMTSLMIVGLVMGISLVWPIIIPAGVTYYAVNKIREKNLHKKKMWNELKGN